MMGQRTQHQGQLFYSFDLNAAVPDDHLVRLRQVAPLITPRCRLALSCEWCIIQP